MVICDSGLGIPKTIAEKFTVQNDIAAIELAIRKRITSKPDFGQGNGLAGQGNRAMWGVDKWRSDCM